MSRTFHSRKRRGTKRPIPAKSQKGELRTHYYLWCWYLPEGADTDPYEKIANIIEDEMNALDVSITCPPVQWSRVNGCPGDHDYGYYVCTYGSSARYYVNRIAKMIGRQPNTKVPCK